MCRAIVRLALLLAAALAAPARADGERAGAFEYYVLALSWTPGWCVREGDGRGDPICADGAGTRFVLHGLWPQAEPDPPSFCRTASRDPTRAETAAMADIMGSAGLAWYQWRKHGRCSGLAPERYFAAARAAFGALRLPEAFRAGTPPGRITPRAIEAAFLAVNPRLGPDGLTVTCRDGALHEVRICLTRSFEPRTCGPSVREDCRAGLVAVDPPR